MKAILLVLITFSLSYAEFTRSNEMVTDSKTGLVWQDDAAPASSWQGAINYCEALTLGGDNDWRLPNMNELTSIVDYTYSTSPAISNVFVNTVSNYYWSSTAHVAYPNDYAWILQFGSGVSFAGGTGSKAYGSFSFRCVRAGQ